MNVISNRFGSLWSWPGIKNTQSANIPSRGCTHSRQLIKSRLSRRIVTSVFLSIVAIESIILIPSYWRREQEHLHQLEWLSTEVLLPSIQTKIDNKQGSQAILTKCAAQLNPKSLILGGALYTANGQLLGVFGKEPPNFAADVVITQKILRQRQERDRYDVLWPAAQLKGDYILAVRHDISGLSMNMFLYVLRIGGLVLLISAFVTLVTILVLGQILIKPILCLRDDLIASGEAVSQNYCPNFNTLSQQRTDELGEVATAFRQMFQRIQQEIWDRKQAEVALRSEQEKSERLLLNILPSEVASQLKNSPGAIASRCSEATILFADIVDFTGLAANMPPADLVDQLNEIFSAFDTLTEQHGLEKIKTIGDAYMVVGGLPTHRSDHAEAVLDMAIDMLQAIRKFRRQDGKLFQLRIGINTGPVVAGVIGLKKFTYDLWGDTVNIASRLESHGQANKIQVSEATYHYLQHKHLFAQRGSINLKGRGEMQTYLWVRRQMQFRSSVPAQQLSPTQTKSKLAPWQELLI